MMLKSSLAHISAGLLVIVLVACMATPGGQTQETDLPVLVLAAGRQCLPAPEGWTATWISSPMALQEMMNRCRSNRIGPGSTNVPDVDFERFGVLAVEMGQQPSAGYGIDPETVTARVAGGAAVVTLDYHRPRPGAMTAQMITGPWILIQLPADAWHSLRVMDQDAVLLTRMDRP